MTVAHVPYFVAFVFLQPYFPVPQSAESATRILLPAAPFRSLFLLRHIAAATADGPVAGAGRRVDKQASSTCECFAIRLKIFFRLSYLFSHVSIFPSNLSVELLS